MSSDGAPSFRLRQVRKQYGATRAVDLQSLEIKADGVLCLLGPTGAGKSTLLRLLAAIEEPTTGEIWFQADFLRRESPLAVRRRIGMVFQRPVMLTGTVRYNVEYGLKIRGHKRPYDARVTRVLERLELAHLAGRSARTLSGGQAQLVALARTLVLEPEALLLDEPTANLDPAHVALVERVIQEDCRQRRTSVVWATHNLFQARRVAQQVALILNGRLVEAAPTELFFESPSDDRTRDFVEGKMVY